MNEDEVETNETLDPRVQIELEQLNSATDEINRLEVELDESRLGFRRLVAEGHLRIQQLTRKLGTSVHKARPYYEARFRASITAQDLQTANIAYDKANSAHSAAREMVYLAEQGLARLGAGAAGVQLDPAWQEMLNHATARVNQAECDRAAATAAQRCKAATHRAAAALVQQLQGNLKRHIAKSRPYFEEKARINAALDAQKARVQALEARVADAKAAYAAALRRLERISDEIHRHRHAAQVTAAVRTPSRTPSRPPSGAASPPGAAASPPGAGGGGAGGAAEGGGDAVREWLRRADDWTDIELDSPSDEVSFEKCSLNPLSNSEKSSPPSPMEPSRVSAASPRRIILAGGDARRDPRDPRDPHEGPEGRGPRAAPPRRPSIDVLLHDTGERLKDMFQGFSMFGERRGSQSAPRTPRRAPSPRSDRSSDDRSDTDSLASMEMLTDQQIASLMLDAQLEAVCERLDAAPRARY